MYSQLLNWNAEDVKCWLKGLGMVHAAERVRETNLNGGWLITLTFDEILDMLQIGQYNTSFNLNHLNPSESNVKEDLTPHFVLFVLLRLMLLL